MSTNVLRRGPLCRAQYFEWWLTQCLPSRAHANLSFEVDYPEGVSRRSAETATRAVLARHEAFRTTFGLDESGLPEQRVHPISELPPVMHMTLADPQGRTALVRELRKHEFGPSEIPVRATIVETGDGRASFLVLCCYHLVTDFHSLEIVRAQILSLLSGQAAPGPPALPAAGPQLLDIAQAERAGQATRGEDAARRYWEKSLAAAPTRTFWRSYPASTGMCHLRMTSPGAPVLLSRYALAHGSTPSIVYTALIHVMMSLISGGDTTLVRFYFVGRGRGLENAVGPFHRHLFSAIGISDSDTLPECVHKAGRAIMAARARYSLDHLAFREAELREEARRGTAFAWGTVVSAIESADYLAGWRELPAAAPPPHQPDILDAVEAIGPDVNERGLEVFLSTMIDTAYQGVQAEYNSAAFSRDSAEFLVRGPWDILRNCLAAGEEPTIADLRKRYGLAAAKPTQAAPDYGEGLRDTQEVLGQLPGVTASLVTVRAAHPADHSPATVLAYVAVDRPSLTAGHLRDHLMAALNPMAAVRCPDYFIVCGAAPPDPASEESWRAARRLSEGTGTGGCRPAGRTEAETEQEAALLRAVSAAHGGLSPDLAKGYVEGGGALLKVPGILRRLDGAGFTGLQARDFDGHARLYQLAARLRGSRA